MSRRRRVLHVIPFLWSGAGRVVTRLCEEQVQSGADVHIATSGEAKGQRDWPAYRRRLASAGVTWHQLNTFDRRPESLWPAVQAATRLVEQMEPSVIHAHAGVATLVATLSRPSFLAIRPSPLPPAGPLIVGQMYSWGPNRPEWMDTMDVLAFSRADRVIVSARRYERLLLSAGVRSGTMTYLPWGVDLPSQRDAGRPARRLRLGFVGRIEPRKDQLTLVEVVGRMVRAGHDVGLLLVGPDGDERYARQVRQRIEKLGLIRRVRLTGEVKSIWPWLARMDIFVSFSKDEGQGLAVLEAMAAGVPVVARPAAGLEDFLDSGQNGLWLQGSGAETLSRALAAAVSDRTRLSRYARQARQMVRRRYTWPATLRAVETVYGW